METAAPKPMKGIKIVEVAQYTLVPAAAAILADWGADVIKVEHPRFGDAQRAIRMGLEPDVVFDPIMEHSNRGKRGIGLVLGEPDARAVLYDLVRESDVFLTNFLPDARERLAIDAADIRGVNPRIVYVRGTAVGTKGAEAGSGGNDVSTFWLRGGGAAGYASKTDRPNFTMPAPAYGDSMGAVALAGGVAAALFMRDRTGEAPTVDVSLLGMALWAEGVPIAHSLMDGEVFRGPRVDQVLPLGHYETADKKWIYLRMFLPGPIAARYLADFAYWVELCECLDRAEWLKDPRFSSLESLASNAGAARDEIRAVIAERTFAEWLTRLRDLTSVWAPVQDSLDVAADPQVRANGYLSEIRDSDGKHRELVANPVQFEEAPVQLQRAPMIGEHTDDILREMGRSDDEIARLRSVGAAG